MSTLYEKLLDLHNDNSVARTIGYEPYYHLTTPSLDFETLSNMFKKLIKEIQKCVKEEGENDNKLNKKNQDYKMFFFREVLCHNLLYRVFAGNISTSGRPSNEHNFPSTINSFLEFKNALIRHHLYDKLLEYVWDLVPYKSVKTEGAINGGLAVHKDQIIGYRLHLIRSLERGSNIIVENEERRQNDSNDNTQIFKYSFDGVPKEMIHINGDFFKWGKTVTSLQRYDFCLLDIPFFLHNVLTLRNN